MTVLSTMLVGPTTGWKIGQAAAIHAGEREAVAAGLAGIGHDREAVAGRRVKPLAVEALTEPASVALPVMASWPYSLPDELPPMPIVSDAEEPCV